MEIYYTPALLTLVALVAQVRVNKRLDRAVLIACALVIALLAGLRWYADVDYEMYADMFTDNPMLSDFSAASIAGLYGEPGYLLLTAAFKSLGAQFFLVALACAVVSLFLKAMVADRLTAHASLAVCFYLCLHFVTIEFIQMRWAVATAFIVLGFYLQFKGRTWAAVIAFALSLAFHYFSVVFWVAALAVSMKGYRRYYVLFGASILGVLFLNGSAIADFLISDSRIYVLQRITRYATVLDSQVGLFSFAKLFMYPVLYGLCVRAAPAYAWKEDRLNVFLFKVSLVSLSLTLLVSFIPTLHFRATVVADFFAIMWVLNAIRIAYRPITRSVAFAGLGLLYCTWYLLDLQHYVSAGRVFGYQTWLSSMWVP